MKYNPYLKSNSEITESKRGGTGYIESPEDKFMNMVWQTRSAEPDEYEQALCETLSSLFAKGVEDLSEVVQGLNNSNVRPPSGKQWTEENFQSELKRLGA